MSTLRDIFNLTKNAHTRIYVCDAHAEEFMELTVQAANDDPGETEVQELTADSDGNLRVWIHESPETIGNWKLKYGC